MLELAARQGRLGHAARARQDAGRQARPRRRRARIVQHDGRAGRRGHGGDGRQVHGRSRRLRGRLRHRGQPRRDPRADGRRHRLRAVGGALRRDHAQGRRGRAVELPRLPGAADQRDAGGRGAHRRRRRTSRRASASPACRRSRRRWPTRSPPPPASACASCRCRSRDRRCGARACRQAPIAPSRIARVAGAAAPRASPPVRPVLARDFGVGIAQLPQRRADFTGAYGVRSCVTARRRSSRPVGVITWACAALRHRHARRRARAISTPSTRRGGIDGARSSCASLTTATSPTARRPTRSAASTTMRRSRCSATSARPRRSRRADLHAAHVPLRRRIHGRRIAAQPAQPLHLQRACELLRRDRGSSAARRQTLDRIAVFFQNDAYGKAGLRRRRRALEKRDPRRSPRRAPSSAIRRCRSPR